ncbi:hypothetical protein NE626_15780, partial [Intestinimonas massiliensis]|nr:hypothetical protein [Intestinimonas massiliensis (ex Afouda et al. 2020)]
MLIFAVTLHNIPEGMAVGLSFALAAQRHGSGVESRVVRCSLLLAPSGSRAPGWRWGRMPSSAIRKATPKTNPPAAGVMIAASVWSLLIPAIEEAEGAGQV